MTIDGRDAASLRLNDCTAKSACEQMRIYCPPHSDGEKRCILEGNNNLDIRQLYAVNSWDDIDFITSNKTIWDCDDTALDYNCTMYCDINLDKSCIFSNGWKCDGTSSYCHNLTSIAPTEEPTKNPTKSPTPSPVTTTGTPTLHPVWYLPFCFQFRKLVKC